MGRAEECTQEVVRFLRKVEVGVSAADPHTCKRSVHALSHE